MIETVQELEIKQEQLEYLLQLGFSCPIIADVLGVSFITEFYFLQNKICEY